MKGRLKDMKNKKTLIAAVAALVTLMFLVAAFMNGDKAFSGGVSAAGGMPSTDPLSVASLLLVHPLAEEFLFAPLGLDCAFSAAYLKQPELLADLYWPGGGVGWSVRRQLQEVPSQTLGQTHHIYQGNLTVSACDYARLLCLLLNDGCKGSVRVLPEGTAQEILKTQFSGVGKQYGLFISFSDSVISGRTVAYHTGSNFGMYAAFAVDPQTGTGAVVLTSGASGAADGSGIYAVCAKMLRACFIAAQ